ncbi:Protein kiaa0556 [Clonorchis sinensis]|uniref:Protein kiaa0556 n=1 Tax=Clonorchis sinensis TaxID=79923 RepID=A0A8T1M3L0_CLOSI|nr:Protein kiaa0556 [Clonorchis sinensis]
MNRPSDKMEQSKDCVGTNRTILRQPSSPVKVVLEQVDISYRKYLEQLREKNRQRRALQKKSRESIRRHRLEDGFKLYFNIPSQTKTPMPRVYKTAVEKPNSAHECKRPPDQGAPLNQPSNRATSAPNLKRRQQPRRAWVSNVRLDRDYKQSQEGPPNSRRVCSKPMSSPAPSKPAQTPEGKMSVKNVTNVPRSVGYHSDDLESQRVHYGKPIQSVVIQLDVFDNWGDPDIIGLNCLKLLLNGREFCPATAVDIKCSFLDGSAFDDFAHSPEALQRLMLAPCHSSSLCDLWMTKASRVPFRLLMKFHKVMHSAVMSDFQFLQLRIWNFNVPNMLEAGIKSCKLSIEINETPVVSGHFIQVKKASGMSSGDNDTLLQVLLSSDRDGQWGAGKILSTGELPHSTELERNCPEISHKSLLANVNEDLLNQQQYGQHKHPLSKSLKKFDSLEESWSSLDFFNHFHAGRLFSDHNSFNDPYKVYSAQMCDNSSIPKPSCDIIDCSSNVPVSNVSQTWGIEFESQASEDSDVTVIPTAEMQTKLFCPCRPSGRGVIIPELPSGRRLLIDIINTWGDQYYVGLSGIEIFTTDGKNISSFCSVCADPADINILPEYGQDPRIIDNILDDVNWTRDDVHMWLTPFTAGERHLIEITLPLWARPIAMLRIWNYNKSRVHTSRGAREIIMYMDDEPIFQGEIRRASGLEAGSPEECSETILFTTDDHILELIAANDETLKIQTDLLDDALDKPCDIEMRPVTVVSQSDVHSEVISEKQNFISSALKELSLAVSSVESHLINFLDILLLEPWQPDSKHVGLAGIELLDEKFQSVRIEDVSVLRDNSVVQKSVGTLFDNKKDTIDRTDMWCCEYDPGSTSRLRVRLSSASQISGIRIWNYDSSQVDQDYGVKLIKLMDDHGHVLGRTNNTDIIMVRRAPGHNLCPFAQLVLLKRTLEREQLSEIYPALTYEDTQHKALPLGFVYQIQIFSAWDDEYYVGLNGLQLLGPTGLPIPREAFHIFASPKSVDELYPMAQRSPDVRTADKLVDGINCGPDIARHCWLAPIFPGKVPSLFLVFDEPVKLAGLRMWNYTRSPERGVREFSVLVDHQLIFRGYLPKAQVNASDGLLADSRQSYNMKHVLPNQEVNSVPHHHYTVAFDQEIVRQFGEDPGYILGDGSHIGFGSEGSFLKLTNVESRMQLTSTQCSGVKSYSARPANQTLRPFTCVAHRS